MTPNTPQLLSKEGLHLYTHTWQAAPTPKARVVLIHGLGEHSGRYQHVIEHLQAQGYTITALDLRGHGKSEGVRAYVEHFDQHLDDVEAFLNFLPSSDKKTFIFGHSMGGLIITLLAAQNRLPHASGLITSSPGIKLSAQVPAWMLSISRTASKLMPKVPALKLDVNTISRDPAVVAAYIQDPLVYHRGVPMRTGTELIRAGHQAVANLHHITLPFLALHGTHDRLTDPDGSRALYAQASSSDKTLKLYDGFFHELLNEPERQTVLDEITAWLDARI